MRRMLFVVCLWAIPACAFAAGSQTYSTPGSYTFTVPSSYGTLTVTVNGAGGGGGRGGGACAGIDGPDGSGGGNSSFNNVVVGAGGAGGQGGQSGSGNGATGASGSASGGDSNTAGAGAGGGSGSVGAQSRGCSFTANGGSGGAGGKAIKTYASGALSAPSGVPVVVGSGGIGGGTTSDFWGQASPGADGSVVISWTDALPPTCTVNVSPTSYNAPGSATLTWSSSGATTFYIANVGYVGASGSTSVGPGSSTSYAGSVSGPGGSANCSGNQTLTVHPYCTFNGSNVTHGSSVTAYQAATVSYGSSCVSQTRTCSDGSLSGTYAYASCSANPPANCTQDGVTVNNGTSRTFYTNNTPPAGQLCSSGTYSLSRTCTNGVLSGSASYQYASCSCVAQTTYTCPDSSTVASTTITSACGSSTTGTSCVSPSFCSTGSSTCLNPTPSYTSSGTLTGHLQIRPQIVKSGSTAKVYWNVGNVSTCSVLGTNGDSWPNLTTSGSGGKTTSAISQATTYTLSCTKIDSTTLTETQVVTLTPVFQER